MQYEERKELSRLRLENAKSLLRSTGIMINAEDYRKIV